MGMDAQAWLDLAPGWLFAVIRDAIVVADARGEIAHWNQAAEALFGFSSADMLGQPLEGVIPDVTRAPQWASMIANTSAGPGGTRPSLELFARRKDGTDL